jgi:hypothetical protein
VFWGGIICADGSAQVSGLYCIDHEPQGWRVGVTQAESRWLLRCLSERDEKLLAQMHSHPREAFHSEGDNDHATSFHTGYISIVAPNFASRTRKPSHCAVYEYRDERFERLTEIEVESRIIVHAITEEGISRWRYSTVSSRNPKLSASKKR